MTAPPPESPPVKRPRRWLRWLLFGLVGAGGSWLALWAVLQQVAHPFIERQVSQTLERPVELGDISGFSFHHLGFKTTHLPATATDADHATAERVVVRFNPWTVALQRRLELDLTFHDAAVYIEQDRDGTWINLPTFGEEESPIQIRVVAARVRGARVTAHRRRRDGTLNEAVVAQVRTGNLLLKDGIQAMEVGHLRGELAEGGQFQIFGQLGLATGSLETMTGQLRARLRGVDVPQVLRLGPPLPVVDILQGKVSANVTLTLAGNPFSLESLPDIEGTAWVEDVAVRVDPFQPLATVNRGRVQMRGQFIELDRLPAKVGEIPMALGGLFSITEPNAVTVEIAPVGIEPVLTSFGVGPLPMDVAGAIALTAQVTGPLDQLIMTGNIRAACLTRNPCTPLTVDRVGIRALTSNFRITVPQQQLWLDQLTLTPEFGGEITGQGLGSFQDPDRRTADFQLNWRNLPINAALARYDLTLGQNFGLTSGQGQGRIPLNNWQNGQITFSTGLLGGTVQGSKGPSSGENWTATLNAKGVRLPLDLPLGATDARIELAGRWDQLNLEAIAFRGQGQTQIGRGRVIVPRFQLQRGNVLAVVVTEQVPLGEFRPLLPNQWQDLPLGNVNGELALAGQLKDWRPTAIASRGSLFAEVAGGMAEISGLGLRGDDIVARIQGQNFNSAALAALVPQPLPFNLVALGAMEGQVAIATQLSALLQGNINRILDGLTLGGAVLARPGAGGTGTVSFSLSERRWQSNIAIRNLNPTGIFPQLPPQFAQALTSEFNLTGLIPRRFALDQWQVSGSGQATLGQSRITVPSLDLINQTLRAEVIPEQVPLAFYSPLLRGNLGGKVNLSLPLFDLARLEARGNVQLSEGFSLVRDPIASVFRWGQGRLSLDSLTGGENLNVQGYLNVNLPRLLRGQLGPQLLEDFQLAVRAADLDLAEIAPLVAEFADQTAAMAWVDLRGLANFNGTIKGRLANPLVAGDLRLVDLAFNEFVFDPELAGPVTIDRRSGTIDLLGNGATDPNRLQIALGNAYRPIAFDIHLGPILAQGYTEDQILTATLTQLPLAQTKPFLPRQLLPPLIAAQPFGGNLTGRVRVDWLTGGVAGEIAIENPVLAQLKGEYFSGVVQYNQGAIVLRDSHLIIGASRYDLSGELIPFGPDPRMAGEIVVQNGFVEDIFTALDWVNFSDVVRFANSLGQTATGRAADLQTVAVGRPGATLPEQLSRLSEIRQLNAQRRRASIDNFPLPRLDEIAGAFDGKITFAGPLTADFDAFTAQVELEGQNWQWGDYQAETVTLLGNLAEGVVRLRPLELASEEGLLSLAGVFSAAEITGQLQIDDFPIITLQDLLPLPPAIGLGGTINLTATLSGDRANPRALGRVNILNASVNETPISAATANFSYNNARFAFSANSTLIPEGTPLRATGQIPYQIPIPGTLPPEDYQFRLSAQVSDDGLAILNILTRQNLIWQAGSADVNVDLQGEINPDRFGLDSLIADGTVILADGVMGSKLLPDVITDINGRIALNFDQIDVEEITGKFGGGLIQIAGSLPTFQTRPVENPLTAELEALAIALQGLFSGTVQGNVQILGTALAPEITGTLGVRDGELQLLGAAALSGGEADGEENGFFELQNLRLVLTNDFRIRQNPFLDLFAQGELLANGTLGDLQLEGAIALKSGYVNLFTTTLRLDNSYQNQAIFTAFNGLDPFLDLRLVGSVLESNQRSLAVESLSSEISDSRVGLGSLQNIIVRAEINGSAFELADTLRTSAQTGARPRPQLITLTSSPGRSETEILALLGGSFINSVAGGDGTALVGGLANIAGTTLFGEAQRAIAEALTLSEFRIFPAQVINEDNSAGGLGVAMELGKTVADRVSLSVLQFITPPGIATRYNIRYRVNNNFTIRGSTDFQGDSRTSIEYETRF
ncbi:MAG: hypothetical protein EA366_04890 [Spirulina sp. DLM2.Bin59]|nr:MAG: hypothetical protein EA366_04890 [Spirulina sp. DLM2.Bin59]